MSERLLTQPCITLQWFQTFASDVDGRYRGTDLNVHTLDEGAGNHYSVFSLWDTYRALHPLLAWIEPNRTEDMIKSMLRMYADGGQLPVWELASNYTGCMIAEHVPVIVDAEQWGLEGWDHSAIGGHDSSR